MEESGSLTIMDTINMCVTLLISNIVSQYGGNYRFLYYNYLCILGLLLHGRVRLSDHYGHH